jgi:predicted DNA-binding transcriptional regulator AlpA
MRTKPPFAAPATLEGKPLTKPELAEWVGLTTRFIEGEVKKGNLRAVIIGRRTVRFLPSDINSWLNTRPSTRAEDAPA